MSAQQTTPPTQERIERALQVLAYLEGVADYEPMSASEWLECADGLSRPPPDENSAKWGRPMEDGDA